MKIRKQLYTRYEEIRELEGGHSTRGTGQYTSYDTYVYIVGRKSFSTLEGAKRYILRTKNKNKLKRLSLKKKKLEKELRMIEKLLYKLGQ